MAQRQSKVRATRQTKAQKCIEANAALLITLDELAALPPEPCKCGLDTEHTRCAKCGACNPAQGAPCQLYSNYRGYTVHGCGECGAKANMYSTPVYTWYPKARFATSFARDLAFKIRRGLSPSPKQVALAEKLSREDHTQKPFVWDRPALSWVSPKWRKAWTALLEITAGVFSLTADAVVQLDFYVHNESQTRETREAGKEIVELVRRTAQKLIEDRTGYAVLTSLDDYADAMKAVAGDKPFEVALHALLDVHMWLVREKRVIDECPAHLVGLRKDVSFGDADAAIVLADAIASGHTAAA